MILRPVRPESPIGAADDEAAGRVDEVLGLLVEQVASMTGSMTCLLDVACDLLLVDLRRVLGRDDDRVDARRLAVSGTRR